ncbi:MAG: carboxypeptidase-like regulatory domain-containing protein [Halobacteriales archaeon]|nr:carboxypeptidase-like regulatory domain-containing protein [Halobacteriales archaeon]
MRGALPALAALLLAGCTAAVVPSHAAPTGRIDGAVVDGYLSPYPYQNVTLVDLGLVDQTSRLGGFTFRDVPSGTYMLVAQREGTDGDAKVVEVRAGQVTRVILQMLPRLEPLPSIESHRFTNIRTELAQPGTECAECTRTAFVLQEPKELVVQAIWDGLPGGGLAGDSTLTVTLTDRDGEVFGSATGTSPLELDLRDALPSKQKVEIHVEFGPDFTPRPFQMSSMLTLYYVKDRAAQQGA